MLLVFPGNPLVGLGHLVGQLSQHLVGSRSAWTGSAGTWSAAVWRERGWLPSSSQLNLLPPFLVPSFPLRLNFSSPTSSFPPSPGSATPPHLSHTSPVQGTTVAGSAARRDDTSLAKEANLVLVVAQLGLLPPQPAAQQGGQQGEAERDVQDILAQKNIYGYLMCVFTHPHLSFPYEATFNDNFKDASSSQVLLFSFDFLEPTC